MNFGKVIHQWLIIYILLKHILYKNFILLKLMDKLVKKWMRVKDTIFNIYLSLAS